MTKDERELIDEKFKNLHIEINSKMAIIDQKLDFIKDQTTKTNSRVSHTEEDIIALEKKLDEKVAWGKEIISTRTTNCPNLEEIRSCRIKIEKIENKLEDVFFFVKHPKLFIGIIVAVVLLSLATFITNNPLSALHLKPNIENVQK